MTSWNKLIRKYPSREFWPPQGQRTSISQAYLQSLEISDLVFQAIAHDIAVAIIPFCLQADGHRRNTAAGAYTFCYSLEVGKSLSCLFSIRL